MPSNYTTAGFTRGNDGGWLVRVTFDGRAPVEGDTVAIHRNRDGRKEVVTLTGKLWEGDNLYDGGRKCALYTWEKAKKASGQDQGRRFQGLKDSPQETEPPPRRPSPGGQILWAVVWTEGGQEREKRMDEESAMKLIREMDTATLATAQVWRGAGGWVNADTLIAPF